MGWRRWRWRMRRRGRGVGGMFSWYFRWVPNEIRIVSQALVQSKVPIFFAAEVKDMGIKKDNVRTAQMEIAVDIVLRSHSTSAAVVVEPGNAAGLLEYRKLCLAAQRIEWIHWRVHIPVETIMEEVGTVAASRIRRADPNHMPRINAGIVMPRGQIVRHHVQ